MFFEPGDVLPAAETRAEVDGRLHRPSGRRSAGLLFKHDLKLQRLGEIHGGGALLITPPFANIL